MFYVFVLYFLTYARKFKNWDAGKENAQFTCHVSPLPAAPIFLPLHIPLRCMRGYHTFVTTVTSGGSRFQCSSPACSEQSDTECGDYN